MLCIKLVNYWDKYTEMHGQQNVKTTNIVLEIMLQYRLMCTDSPEQWWGNRFGIVMPRDRKFQFRKTNTHHVTHTSRSSAYFCSHATSFIETLAVELMSSNWCLAHTLFDIDISSLKVVVERYDTLYLEINFGVLCHVLALGLCHYQIV